KRNAIESQVGKAESMGQKLFIDSREMRLRPMDRTKSDFALNAQDATLCEKPPSPFQHCRFKSFAIDFQEIGARHHTTGHEGVKFSDWHSPRLYTLPIARVDLHARLILRGFTRQK